MKLFGRFNPSRDNNVRSEQKVSTHRKTKRSAVPFERHKAGGDLVERGLTSKGELQQVRWEVCGLFEDTS